RRGRDALAGLGPRPGPRRRQLLDLRALTGARCRCLEPRQRLVAAEDLDRLEEAGADLRAGDGDADRLEGVARLEAEAVRERTQGRLDVLGVERLGLAQRLDRLAEDRRTP